MCLKSIYLLIIISEQNIENKAATLAALFFCKKKLTFSVINYDKGEKVVRSFIFYKMTEFLENVGGEYNVQTF